MKCPKCGFNSFEYHDSCKKCAHDLTGYKQTYGMQALVLPREARETLATSHAEETVEVGQAPQMHETVADMFSFDLPEEEMVAPEAPQAADDNPFHFGEGSAPLEPPSFYEVASDTEQKSAQAKAEEDAFASLLESAGQNGGGDTAATVTPAATRAAAPTDTAGEFDMENFSWDDTPLPTAQPAPSSAPETADGGFGEFDLENFTWEGSPAAPAGTETASGNEVGTPFDDRGVTTKK